MSKEVFVITGNHFDPTWRRCWNRRFTWNGRSFASYAEIEEANIADFLAYAEGSDYTYVLEQGISLQEFLRRHPEALRRLRELAKAGRFEVLGAGWVTPDANMPSGETLARNLMSSILYVEDTLGVDVVTGSMWDVFGASAQMPQIFRLCEIKWVPFLSYCHPGQPYWRGLDGSVVCTATPYARKNVGSYYKYPPCQQCSGEGCSACKGRGFGPTPKVDRLQLIDDFAGFDTGLVHITAEETLPSPELPADIARANETQSEARYRFGTFRDVLARIGDVVEGADSYDERPERIDGNPTMTGCYVSRSAIKRNLRRVEGRLLQAESSAAQRWWHGAEWPQHALDEAWRLVFLASFHDAVTGSHVDPPFDELMDNFARVDELVDEVLGETGAGSASSEVSIYNGLCRPVTNVARVGVDGAAEAVVKDADGLPVPVVRRADGWVEFVSADLPPLGCKAYRVERGTPEQPAESSDAVIENERYRVEASEGGVTSIFDKELGEEVLDTRALFGGELILERDAGDPWTVREMYRPRVRLGPFTRLVGCRRADGASELLFEGSYADGYQVLSLSWVQRVRLLPGLPRVEFETDIDWQTYSKRIRVAFPTRARGSDAGVYGIPYGACRRERYEKTTRDEFTQPCGDWPAFEWVATLGGGAPSVGLINAGTPSCRIEDGAILMSLLRSPTFPHCLDEPAHYVAPVYDGMRDPGRHEFRYALVSYKGDWREAGVAGAAREFNRPPIVIHGSCEAHPPIVTLDAPTARVEAVKRSEDGEALIVRICEWAGRACDALLQLPEGCGRPEATNLLERGGRPLEVSGGKARLLLRPFEIATVRIERGRRG